MSRKQRIHECLSELKPLNHLIIEDESPNHHVPTNAETHFKVTVVSSLFEHQNRVSRHRLVMKCLDAEFKTGLHALSLHLYTPEEWQQKSMKAPASPPCQHRHVES